MVGLEVTQNSSEKQAQTQTGGAKSDAFIQSFTAAHDIQRDFVTALALIAKLPLTVEEKAKAVRLLFARSS